MKPFTHFNAYSVDEAVSLLDRFSGKAALIAGGTDLLGKMKDRVSPKYPEALINLKTIPELHGIREQGETLVIGALTRLDEVARHPVVQSRYTALSQAAARTASPQLRNMATIGGNICQDIRCWYYRSPRNRFPCLRKGGGRCYAIEGDSRFHSIFGGSVEAGCMAVHPSDTAPALTALGARVVTSKRSIAIEDFFKVGVRGTTVLEGDEMVTEIHIPEPAPEQKSAFLKYALRKSIDFAVVNCAAAISIEGQTVTRAIICLNAVHVTPRRPVMAEESITGSRLGEEAAEKAGEAAVADARPMKDNSYMVQVAKTLVKRTILAASA